MSGGHFDYDQYKIRYIADEIEQIIRKNNVKRGNPAKWESEFYSNYSDETIENFKEAWYLIRKAEIYAQRVDWLVSGDDGEKTFAKRLQEDLADLDKEKESKTFDYIPDDSEGRDRWF